MEWPLREGVSLLGVGLSEARWPFVWFAEDMMKLDCAMH
jgi:hypothetical protein